MVEPITARANHLWSGHAMSGHGPRHVADHCNAKKGQER